MKPPGVGIKSRLAYFVLRILLPVMAALILTAGARAQSDTEKPDAPGIIGKDDRVAIQDNGSPWGAIGQVNIAGYRTRGLCTGTLIAPRLVLTAAHCMFDPVRKLLRPENIHFAAGVIRDTSLAHSVAACVKFPPGVTYVGPEHYNADLPQQMVTLKDVRRDLALIVLKDPITEVAPMPTAALKPRPAGETVTHAAYPADRRYMLMAHRGCTVLNWSADFIMTDCDSYAASSGGPLLLETADEVRLIGVLSTVVNGMATIFIPVSSWDPLPLDATCP